MKLFKNLTITAAAVLVMGTLATTSAFAAAANTWKATNNSGNAIAVEELKVTPDMETLDSISITDETGTPIKLDSFSITPDEKTSDTVSVTDEKGRPIKLDSLSISTLGVDQISMKSLGYSDSDLEEKDSFTIHKEAWTQKK